MPDTELSDDAQFDALPTYRLMMPVEALAKSAVTHFLGDGPVVPIVGRTGQLRYRAGSKHVDLDPRTGWIWAADDARLWTYEPDAEVPVGDAAAQIAHTYLASVGLFPSSMKAEISFLRQTINSATLARYDKETGVRTDHQIGAIVSYATSLKPLGLPPFPIVGDVGRLGVTLGDGGGVMGFYRSWQDLDDPRFEPFVSAGETDEIVRANVPGLVGPLESHLAYETVERDGRRYLVPVRLYRPRFRVGNDPRVIETRTFALPATRDSLRIWATALKMTCRTTCAQNVVATPRAAGGIWIQDYGGLKSSDENVCGGLAALPRQDWTPKFACGDANSSEVKWTKAGADWTESVDFLFYDGHADDVGWQVDKSVASKPGAIWLDYNDLKTFKLGRKRLRWLALAACGPLRDHVSMQNGLNVFEGPLHSGAGWRHAFGGLRVMLAYATPTYAVAMEASTLLEFSDDPHESVIHSWFRATKRSQPPSGTYDGARIWAAVMYGYAKGGTPPSDDQPFANYVNAPDCPDPRIFEVIFVPL